MRMRRWFRYPVGSFRFRILINLILFTTIPFVAISIMTGLYLYNDYKSNYILEVKQSLTRVAEPIHHDFARYMDRSSLILTGPYYIPLLNNKQSIQDIALVIEFQTLFEATFSEADLNQYFFILKNYTGLKGSYIEQLSERDSAEAAFIEEKVINGDRSGFVWKPELTVIKNTTYITFYRNLITLSAFKGVLVVNIPLRNLESHMRDFKSKLRDVQILLEKGNSYYLDGKIYDDNPFPGNRVELAEVGLKDGSRLIAYIPDTIFLHRLLWIIAWMTAVLLLLVLAVIYTSSVTASKITRSFNDFVAYLKNHDYSLDDHEIWKASNGNDEMDVIKNKLIHVLRKLNDTFSALARSQTSNVRLEMELLQARINPHLLYNTLSVIKWSLLKQRDQRGADTIDLMTDYYRIALNKGSGMIPVAKELKMIKLYMDIVRYTHDGNYQYEEHIEESVLIRSIPLNLLQPIVENSIMHGLNGMKGEGKLQIRGYMDGKTIVFTIEDNGFGIHPEKIEQLLKLEYRPEYGGYGLKNAIRRLNNLNGKPGGLLIESVPREWTRVTIRIDSDRLSEGESLSD